MDDGKRRILGGGRDPISGVKLRGGGMIRSMGMIGFVRKRGAMDDRVIDSNIDVNIDASADIGNIGIMGWLYWGCWVRRRASGLKIQVQPEHPGAT